VTPVTAGAAGPSAASQAVPCEICGNRQHDFRFEKDGYPFLRCRSCGHWFVPWTDTDQKLFETYEQNFFSEGAYADYQRDKPALQRNFRRLVERLRRIQPAGRLFEVGCAYGFFLELAQRRWESEGIDIHGEGIRHARNTLKVTAREGHFLKVQLPEAHYDWVVMWDTIEHLRNPGDYLDRAARILKPGGRLALTTGDVGSWMARLQGKRWRLYYPPHHLHYFSRATLGRLLRDRGLEPEVWTTVGVTRTLDGMLYRLLADRKPERRRRFYEWLRQRGWTGTGFPITLDVFDILLVIARKAGGQG